MFVGIEDDGGDSDWVAGVTLSAQAKVRIVAADDSELPECSQADIEAAKPVAQSQKDGALHVDGEAVSPRFIRFNLTN